MIDIQGFKRFERLGWEQSVDAYDNFFGPLTRQMIAPLLAAVRPQAGERFLDVATGPGYLAARARALGCVVLAIDLSRSMVDRARSLQKGGAIDFQVGDAESLNFAANELDIVAMNFGVLHLAEPEKAAREAHRVLRHDGRFGFTVWSAPEESVGFSLMLRAIDEHGSPTVKLPAGPPFFKYSRKEEGLDLLASAGFENNSAILVPLLWRLPSAEALFDAFHHGTARTGGNLRAQPPENREKIRQAVIESAAPFVKPRGIELPMAAWVYAGVKRVRPPARPVSEESQPPR